MSAAFPQEIFLSYSSQDSQFTKDLAAMMRRHGLPVWYSQTNIMGARQWQVEIGTALQRCDWFVVISLAAIRGINVGQKGAVVCFAEEPFR